MNQEQFRDDDFKMESGGQIRKLFQSNQSNNSEIQIPSKNFTRRSYYEVVWDAFKHSPYDFMAAICFTKGSLIYVVAALMYLQQEDESKANWVQLFGPTFDLLSGIFYFIGWRNAWKEEMLQDSYQKYDNLKDLNLYGILLFIFSSVTYIIQCVCYIGDQNYEFSYNIDLQGSSTLFISSILTLFQTFTGYFYENKVDIRISRACKVTRMNQVRQYQVFPQQCLPKNQKQNQDQSHEFSNQKYIYWLIWADTFYVFGSFLYLLYSFIQYTGNSQDKNNQEDIENKQNYLNLFGSILLVIDCLFYIAGFVQGEDQSSYFEQEDAPEQIDKANSIKNMELQQQNEAI